LLWMMNIVSVTSDFDNELDTSVDLLATEQRQYGHEHADP